MIARARRERVAVLCLERSHVECHRDEVLAIVTERAPDLDVTYLGEDPPSPDRVPSPS